MGVAVVCGGQASGVRNRVAWLMQQHESSAVVGRLPRRARSPPSPDDDQFVEPSKATMPSQDHALGVADLTGGQLADGEVIGETLLVLRHVGAENRMQMPVWL